MPRDSIDAQLIAAIDKAAQDEAALEPPRVHLGASVIGRKCLRQVYYKFRWMYLKKHSGRMQRLFKRGHREEDVFFKYLRSLNIEVRDYAHRLMYHNGSDSYVCLDWGDTDNVAWAECDDVHDDPVHHARAKARNQGPKQWKFADHENHFGGSGDCIIADLGRYNLFGPGLGECKTHGEKSFTQLAGKLEDYRRYLTGTISFTGKGLISAKLEHYVQMQVYMHYFGLSWGLYMAVNKNTDDVYFEVVHYKREVAEFHIDRAKALIEGNGPPPRITNNSSWWECKLCDFHEICHHGKEPHKNCRSCVYADPGPGGSWTCRKFQATIPNDFIPKGCNDWDPIK